MIVLVNYPYDPEIRDPEELLGRYGTLRGWARALAQADARVSVVQRFWRDIDLRSDEVDYRFVSDGAGPTVPAWHWSDRAARAAAHLRPSVVHFNGMVFPIAVRVFRRHLARPTPLLVQDHGGIHDGSAGFQDWRWRALHRMGLRAADGFLFAAREQAEPWLRSRILASTQAIYEVPEASSDLYPPLPATSTPSKLPGSPALLWVGRLDQNKDPLTILDGFERAIADLPEAALTMVFGTDELLADLRRRVAESPLLEARVHLLGRVEHAALAALYSAADIFVLGSHHEGGAYALVEALGFGVTPVVSDIPAFRVLTREMNSDINNGGLAALFPVGDSRSFAQAIVILATKDLSGRRLAIREHFARTLSWPAIARSALDIYAQARARGRAKPGG